MANAAVVERTREHRQNRKKNRGRKVEDNQAQAIAKFIRVPPRKARLVMDSVRGKYAMDALAFLRYIPNRAAGYISKVLTSAVANAANNHGLDANRLKLVEARVDEGPRMKRVHPRAQGRAYRILKRMSHISVIVEEVEPKPRKPRKAVGSRAEAARAARTPAPSAPRAQSGRSVPTVTQPADGYVDTLQPAAIEPEESVALELEGAVEAAPVEEMTGDIAAEPVVVEAETAADPEPPVHTDEGEAPADTEATE
jgi:large subunit ribosomal protein L22